MESSSLLPNLRHIIVNTFGSAEPEHVKWIPRLLHPDLLSFEMYSLSAEKRRSGAREVHSWLDQGTCFKLIDQLSRTCPRLETLRLYPAQGEHNELQRATLYNNIANLTHLWSFTFSGATVQEELFLVLGRLPHLETLSLRADDSQVQSDFQDTINVPNDSFPSLRHLDLYQLNRSAMSRICSISPLFRRLVSASIISKGKPALLGRVATKSINSPDVIFTCLGANSPRIEHLTILPGWGYQSCLDITWLILDAFKLMPLRYLSVGTINLESRWSHQNDRPKITWECFLAAVPQLEELHMETKSIEWNELQLLGSWLPNLRLLVFWRIDLCKAEPPTEAINATQPITIRCWSYFGAHFWGGFRDGRWVPHTPDEPSILNAARSVVYHIEKYQYRRLWTIRCICGIWPNATCETDFVGDWPIWSKPNQEAGERLKESIALLNLGAQLSP
ncbi:hypothetical protein FRC08_007166 [Ceratobasidium sp. 394]|nr:hypothetical protein FRC08_007166 [Ceratobasidium sp. 394]